MKRTITILLIALLAVGMCDAVVKKRTRQRASSKRTTKVLKVTPRTENKVLERDGMKLEYQHIEADAYYKVEKEEGEFSNGYSDCSFSVDWPVKLNGGSAQVLQELLLDKYASTDWDGNFVRPATLDALIRKMTRCVYGDNPRLVRKTAIADIDNCLKDISVASVYRLTHNMIGFELFFHIDNRNGLSAGVTFASTFVNYDLDGKRELTSDICFKSGIEQAIAAKLRSDPEMWDFLWDGFKESPYASENFKIDDDGITFFYSKYEIAPGAAGVVEVSMPNEAIRPYAAEALLPFLVK